jgi:hypothetical protein
MPHLTQDVFDTILAYCNDPLTLYKNAHREQWRRISVKRTRHSVYGWDNTMPLGHEDYITASDVMVPHVDNIPINWAKVVVPQRSFYDDGYTITETLLSDISESEWLRGYDMQWCDWPEHLYNPITNPEQLGMYEFAVDYEDDHDWEFFYAAMRDHRILSRLEWCGFPSVPDMRGFRDVYAMYGFVFEEDE